MPLYQYSGINREGSRVKGNLQADNDLDLEQRLASANIEVLNYKIKSKNSFSFGRQAKLTRRDLILMTSEIRRLLKAGIPLMDILDDLRNTFEKERAREILADIYESMEGGDTFSEALQPYKDDFGIVYLSLVAVGERVGALVDILENLENMLKWEEQLISKSKKIMIYPAIVGTVVITVVILLMVLVVPQLLSFIKEMGGELGFATTSLIATSEFIQNHLIALLLSPFILFFLFKYAYKNSDEFHLWFDKNIFKVKLIGQVLYELKIARFANSLSVMYGAGMNFIEAMKLSGAVTNNAYIERNILDAVKLIEEGTEINKAFSEANVMPLMATRMVKVGELSGNIDEALNEVSEYYDTAAKETIEKIEPAIEPVLTVVMAVVVGWVMMAVLGPIYDTISKVQ